MQAMHFYNACQDVTVSRLYTTRQCCLNHVTLLLVPSKPNMSIITNDIIIHPIVTYAASMLYIITIVTCIQIDSMKDILYWPSFVNIVSHR